MHVFFYFFLVCLHTSVPVQLFQTSAVICHGERGADWSDGLPEEAVVFSGVRAHAGYQRFRSENHIAFKENNVCSIKSVAICRIFSKIGKQAITSDLFFPKKALFLCTLSLQRALQCALCVSVAVLCHKIVTHLFPPQTQVPATWSVCAGQTCLRSWLLC